MMAQCHCGEVFWGDTTALTLFLRHLDEHDRQKKRPKPAVQKPERH